MQISLRSICTVYLHRSKHMKKKLFKILLSLLGVLFILALSAAWYIYKYPDFRHQQYVKDYLRENSDLSQEVVAAIKNGKVIMGACGTFLGGPAGRSSDFRFSTTPFTR